MGGNTALIADAAHSLSDLVSDLMTLFVVRSGQRRFEALGSLSVSAIVVGTAGGVGWSAMSDLLDHWNGTVAENMMLASGCGGFAIAACVGSLLIKEALYHVSVRVGHEIKSPTVIANAWHHRSDAFSSVAALIGVGGCLVGMPILDPLSGLVVSGLVAKAGVEIGLDAIKEAVDGARR